jgi:hypothetical protein
MKMAAVTNNGSVIEYVKKPTEEMKMAAVTNTSYALSLIKNKQSLELQKHAIKMHADAILYCSNFVKLQEYAVTTCHPREAIKYICNPTPKTLELAKKLCDELDVAEGIVGFLMFLMAGPYLLHITSFTFSVGFLMYSKM